MIIIIFYYFITHFFNFYYGKKDFLCGFFGFLYLQLFEFEFELNYYN